MRKLSARELNMMPLSDRFTYLTERMELVEKRICDLEKERNALQVTIGKYTVMKPPYL